MCARGAATFPSGRAAAIWQVGGGGCAHKCRYCSSSPPLAQVYRKVGQRRRRGRNAAQGMAEQEEEEEEEGEQEEEEMFAERKKRRKRFQRSWKSRSQSRRGKIIHLD